MKLDSNVSSVPPVDDAGRQPLRIEVTTRTMLTLLLVAAACLLVVKLTPVLLMVVASLMLVGALSPVVEWLEARGSRRGVAIGLLFTVLLALVLAIITFTIPELVAQANSMIEREPALREQLAQWLSQRRAFAPLAESLRRLDYAALLGGSTRVALTLSLHAFETLAYGVGAVFLALYVMLDRDRLRGALYALVPRAHHMTLSRILLNLERIVGGYIRGQVLTCILMGVFVFTLLSVAGVRSALAIAVFAGVVDVLPYIGGLLMLAPALLATLPLGLTTVITVGVLIAVYQEIESRLLIPLVYGRALRLPSSVVLVALLAGAVLDGVSGAILALPVAAALLMLIEELRVELPGESSSPQREQQRESDERNTLEYTSRTEGLPVEKAAAVAAEIVEEAKQAGDPALTPAEPRDDDPR